MQNCKKKITGWWNGLSSTQQQRIEWAALIIALAFFSVLCYYAVAHIPFQL